MEGGGEAKGRWVPGDVIVWEGCRRMEGAIKVALADPVGAVLWDSDGL